MAVLAGVAIVLAGLSVQQGHDSTGVDSIHALAIAANRVEYDFNTRASLLAFVQYDNESERVDFNVRFHWIPVIGDDCYVVWNSGYTTDSQAPFPNTHALARPLNGAFVVKIVHRLTP